MYKKETQKEARKEKVKIFHPLSNHFFSKSQIIDFLDKWYLTQWRGLSWQSELHDFEVDKQKTVLSPL